MRRKSKYISLGLRARTALELRRRRLLEEPTLYEVKYSGLYFTWKLTGNYIERGRFLMSYVVARMQKMKAANLVGVGNHNQRRTENHSNRDIDPSQSYLNYDLVEGRTKQYKTDIQQFIDEKKASKRAIRKDAVLVNEWILTSDSNYFHDLSPSETQKFFREAKNYFSEHFGEDNIRYAQVHMDETTPHMHLGVVPFDQDKKLSAKRVFNRQALRDVQDDLPHFMNERGFSLERGIKGSERKNLSVPEYKSMQEDLKTLKTDKEQKEDEISQLSQNVQELEKDYEKYQIVMDTVKDIEVSAEPVMEKKGFLKREEVETDQVIVSKDDFKELHKAYRYVPALKKELATSRGAELAQRDEKAELRAERNELKKENKSLKRENKELSKKLHGYIDIINVVVEFLKEKTKNLNLGGIFKAMDFELPTVFREEEKEHEESSSKDEMNGPSL